MVSLVHHHELIVYKEYKITKMVRVLHCVCPSILPSTNLTHAPSTHQGKEKELKQHLNQAVACSLSNAVVTGTFIG